LTDRPVPLIVDTGWLAARLNDPDLRIIDATQQLLPRDSNAFAIRSGRDGYHNGHIPGAIYVDLARDLSEQDTPIRYQLPTADVFSAVLGGHGVGDHHHVVVYSAGLYWWATRLWWMFRAFGFKRVSVLDGGFAKWIAEGRPVESTVPALAPTNLFAALDRNWLADQEDVLSALADGQTILVNALSPEQYRGESRMQYGRAGRITNSVNVYARDLVDPDTGCFGLEAELKRRFRAAGISKCREVIAYCGAGIAATGVTFALKLLGHNGVRVYDASMDEWAKDPTLPMESG
jgi:thiosulfate/3-mercaptopyruvate sulfurtransferase